MWSILALVWLTVGNLSGMLPSRRNHWPAAILLVATGVPLAVMLWRDAGTLVAAIFCLAALSILRWPARLLLRRLRGLVRDRRG